MARWSLPRLPLSNQRTKHRKRPGAVSVRPSTPTARSDIVRPHGAALALRSRRSPADFHVEMKVEHQDNSSSASADPSGPVQGVEDLGDSPEHSKNKANGGDHAPAENGQKPTSSKDPSRPRRKKARRACFACQRAHLTCGMLCSTPSLSFFALLSQLPLSFVSSCLWASVLLAGPSGLPGEAVKTRD